MPRLKPDDGQDQSDLQTDGKNRKESSKWAVLQILNYEFRNQATIVRGERGGGGSVDAAPPPLGRRSFQSRQGGGGGEEDHSKL